MLSLSRHPERLRRADNLFPTRGGVPASRPGARQIIDGPVARAVPWGNRIVVERAGRIAVWGGKAISDICQAGLTLQGESYQAFIGDGQREDRLYLADGLRPLWYLADDGDSYRTGYIDNSIRQENNEAYPLEPATTVTSWRDRLFYGDGSNRIRHCQARDPEAWDPLWTLEFQGRSPGKVVCLRASKSALLVGLDQGIWTVTGTSHFNWSRDPLRDGEGVTGPAAIDSDGIEAFFLAKSGLYSLSGSLLTEDLSPLFSAQHYGGQVVVDTRRRLVLFLVHGRVFVMHQDKPGVFGELNASALGLLRMDDYVGWYGQDGVWLLQGEDQPDTRTDGAQSDVISLFETWDHQPNPSGGSFLSNVKMRLKGSPRGSADYNLKVDGKDAYSASITLTDSLPSDDVFRSAEARSVRREVTPWQDGEQFQHSISANCHLEILSFNPAYKGGA
ncbi:MAG: hypothetical protein RPU39_13765 [Candidatus Sedimenticola sp. (ex Thyasira tokunagai)]